MDEVRRAVCTARARTVASTFFTRWSISAISAWRCCSSRRRAVMSSTMPMTPLISPASSRMRWPTTRSQVTGRSGRGAARHSIS